MVPFLYGSFFALWGLGISTDPFVPLYSSAALALLLGFLWFLGWWWVSGSLESVSPVTARPIVIVDSNGQPIGTEVVTSRLRINKSGVVVLLIMLTITCIFSRWLYVSYRARMADSSTAGFMQVEDTQLFLGESTLASGKRFRVNYQVFNRGSRPVSDAQSWGMLISVDSKLNPEGNLFNIFKKGTEVGYLKFRGQGPSIGVNQEQWGTAIVEHPLTLEEFDGLKTATFRMYLLVGAAWTDQHGGAQFSYKCSWFDLKSNDDASKVPWHFCNASQ